MSFGQLPEPSGLSMQMPSSGTRPGNGEGAHCSAMTTMCTSMPAPEISCENLFMLFFTASVSSDMLHEVSIAQMTSTGSVPAAF